MRYFLWHCLQMTVIESQRSSLVQVIGSDNWLLTSGNKTLPEPQCWLKSTSLGLNVLTVPLSIVWIWCKMHHHCNCWGHDGINLGHQTPPTYSFPVIHFFISALVLHFNFYKQDAKRGYGCWKLPWDRNDKLIIYASHVNNQRTLLNLCSVTYTFEVITNPTYHLDAYTSSKLPYYLVRQVLEVVKSALVRKQVCQVYDIVKDWSLIECPNIFSMLIMVENLSKIFPHQDSLATMDETAFPGHMMMTIQEKAFTGHKLG